MKRIYMWMINFALTRLFRYLDKDKDGKLSTKEIKEIKSIVEKVRMKMFKLQRSLRKIE